jgi:flagellar protein FlaI
MQELESYENKKIILEDDGQPKYIVEPYPFTDEEAKVLHNSDKLFTPVELESVRKEPDIKLREKVLHEYIKMKVPDSRNKEKLVNSVVHKVMGYEKLGELIADDNLEEIMVNGINIPIYVFHKKYGMCATNIRFDDKNEVFKLINRLCWIHGKELAPIIDMSAIDGSRINITTDPIAIHGPSLTIRKQKRDLLTITSLLEAGTLDIDVAALLWLSVDGMRISPANLVVAGMIGSGKTTLLNALAMLSPPEDRIITIEDTPELQFAGRGNWVPMVAQSGYDMEALVRNSLRMRPNKIIVGEIRGAEAMALFNAMNVGHKGMGTVHASSAREVISRVESPPMNVPSRIVANLDLIVIMNLFNIKGVPVRRVTEVAEVGGHEKDTVLLGEIYQWDPAKDQAVEGKEMTPSTYLDKLADKLKISKREVLKELEKRKAVLISLVNNKVFEYNEVLAAVDQFYKEENSIKQ